MRSSECETDRFLVVSRKDFEEKHVEEEKRVKVGLQTKEVRVQQEKKNYNID